MKPAYQLIVFPVQRDRLEQYRAVVHDGVKVLFDVTRWSESGARQAAETWIAQH